MRWSSLVARREQPEGRRFKSGPRNKATLAQLVERNLAKVEVTSSNLVCRSNFKSCHRTLNDESRTRGGAAW